MKYQREEIGTEACIVGKIGPDEIGRTRGRNE